MFNHNCHYLIIFIHLRSEVYRLLLFEENMQIADMVNLDGNVWFTTVVNSLSKETRIENSYYITEKDS